jgi:hypothetical protein
MLQGYGVYRRLWGGQTRSVNDREYASSESRKYQFHTRLLKFSERDDFCWIMCYTERTLYSALLLGVDSLLQAARYTKHLLGL